MILTLPDLLSPHEVQSARRLLADAPWADGRDSAGPQARRVKNNEQLPHDCEAATRIRALVLAALERGAIGRYVCDFPSTATHGNPLVIALPHLGASTREAEDNCAVMVVDQLRDFLEHGNVANAVNFPAVSMARESAYRVAIANANVPNMLGQISTAMARAGLNIHNMVNKSRGDMAYTLVDVDSPVAPSALAEIAAIQGVLSVRSLPLVT